MLDRSRKKFDSQGGSIHILNSIPVDNTLALIIDDEVEKQQQLMFRYGKKTSKAKDLQKKRAWNKGYLDTLVRFDFTGKESSGAFNILKLLPLFQNEDMKRQLQ